jgi:hypothetical protein
MIQILKFVRHAQESGIPFEAKEGTIDTLEVHSLLRKAADASIVLLKNDSNVLPVIPAPGLKIAVIGSNAKTPPYAGGGSANLLPTYTITPLQAIEKVAAEMDGTVQWEMGVDTARWTPLLTDFLSLSDKVEEASIVRAEFFDVELVVNGIQNGEADFEQSMVKLIRQTTFHQREQQCLYLFHRWHPQGGPCTRIHLGEFKFTLFEKTR